MMFVPYPTRRFLEGPAFRPFPGFDCAEHEHRCHNGFRTDIRDQGDSFLLEADLPGFRKEDIHVDLEDDCMTITAEFSEETEQKEGSFVRRERRVCTRSRSFDTTGIDTANISASYRDGVLRLVLPKLPEPASNARRLLIE